MTTFNKNQNINIIQRQGFNKERTFFEVTIMMFCNIIHWNISNAAEMMKLDSS